MWVVIGILLGILIVLGTLVGASALVGYIFMLTMGVLHSEVHEEIPALGFYISWGLSALLVMVFKALTGGERNRVE